MYLLLSTSFAFRPGVVCSYSRCACLHYLYITKYGRAQRCSYIPKEPECFLQGLLCFRMGVRRKRPYASDVRTDIRCFSRVVPLSPHPRGVCLCRSAERNEIPERTGHHGTPSPYVC